MGAKNVAVYTAIFGEYDRLLPVKTAGDNSYICFTDHYPYDDVSSPWQVRVVDMPHPDPRFASRYYFDQSTVVLPEYEYTIMHSGNAALTVLPEILLAYLAKTDIAAFRHPRRDSVYKEPYAIARSNIDTWDNMSRQIARYRSEGFSGQPFSACTLLVRRNTPKIQEFEKMWWREVKGGTHRDQLSFDYVRWKLGVKITYIPGHVFRSPFMRRRRKHVR